MGWKKIVGVKFDPSAFDYYVRSLTLSSWKPSFVVVHNTGAPTLAQRPVGLTRRHITNLESYYKGKGWSAGPHCFVDQGGIWVFTPLTTTGVHSPSWNDSSWGIETLGDYDTEEFTDSVKRNLVSCLATLHWKIKADTSTLRFHKEDPQTTHRDCPGKHIVKPELIKAVHDMIVYRKEQGFYR